MKIKLFENFKVDLDVYYEIKQVDQNGDLMDMKITGFKPYDLEEVVKLYLEYKEDFPNLRIYKITKDMVDQDTINRIATTKKYNL